MTRRPLARPAPTRRAWLPPGVYALRRAREALEALRAGRRYAPPEGAPGRPCKPTR